MIGVKETDNEKLDQNVQQNYNEFTGEMISMNNADLLSQIYFYTPFAEQKKDVNRSSALYSIKAPFELAHADVSKHLLSSHMQMWQIKQFFSKSAVDPKYCLMTDNLLFLP